LFRYLHVGHPGIAVLLLAIFAALPAVRVGAVSMRSGAATGNVTLRGGLHNARAVFARTGRGRVAFLGGSITEMNGFRPLVCESLERRFPETAFTFNNAGVASTCSTTGAFRLQSDVLSKGPVDLLFVEFAVNDDQDAHHTRAECIRGMEGIVRRAWRQNPNIDIVFLYFVNPEMLQTLQAGRVPLPIEAHEAVAEGYALPTVNVAKEVADEIAAGTLTWDAYGGTHPGPAGHALCARLVDRLLDLAWSSPLAADASAAAHRLPKRPLDPLSYANGRFIDPQQARVKQGWTYGVPDWERLPGAKRERFTSTPMLCATEPGAELTLTFEGTAVGAYILAGPDAGIAEASIDGGPYREVELYHAFSSGLHYPRTVLLGSDLRPGKHTLGLRISPQTHSAGHAMRILQFTAS
jgi:lysophospholipase L1-like esterase